LIAVANVLIFPATSATVTWVRATRSRLMNAGARQPTAIAAWALRVIERLEGAGVAAGPLLRELGIERHRLTRRGARVPQASLLALVERAAERLGDPFFALRLGYERDPRDAGVLAFLGLNAATLAESLDDARRYLAVNVDGLALVAEQNGSRLSLSLSWSVPATAASPRASELVIGALLRGMRYNTRARLADAIVWLRHSPPGDPAAAKAILQAPIEWSCERDAVTGPCSWLDLPIIGGDPALLAILRDHANQLLAERQAERSIVASVERLVLTRLMEGRVDAAEVAADVGMSPRTLSRRLAAAGTSYATILDELRAGLAQRYVGAEDFSLKQAARLLGFSEAAAFNHAFKRWTGRSPSIWRQEFGLRPLAMSSERIAHPR